MWGERRLSASRLSPSPVPPSRGLRRRRGVWSASRCDRPAAVRQDPVGVLGAAVAKEKRDHLLDREVRVRSLIQVKDRANRVELGELGLRLCERLLGLRELLLPNRLPPCAGGSPRDPASTAVRRSRTRPA